MTERTTKPMKSFLLRSCAFLRRLVLSLVLFGACCSGRAFYMEAALPLYIYPSAGQPDWQRALDAGGDRVGFIVANVYNGPGAQLSSTWNNMLNNTVASGIQTLGYVYTLYGQRPLAEVQQDIQTWLQLYPQTTGFFLDETASGDTQLPYYQSIYNFIKSINPNHLVVINPGTVTVEGYMGACDINTIFESSLTSWNSKVFPAWMHNYPEDRFYAIVYDVPTETDMLNVVTSARSRNFGKLFVTDASTPSGALPAWFESQLDAIVAQRDQSPVTLDITSASVTDLSRSTATINWTTSIPATCSIAIGTSPTSFTAQYMQPISSTTHDLQLHGLARRTTYYYQITANSAELGLSTTSPVYTFKTTNK